MQTRAEILSILQKVKPLLQKKYNVRSIALFGSYSRADATAASDVDLLVDVDASIGIRFVDLADELESLLHKKVDLVSLRAVKPRYFDAIKSQLIYV